jgi:hypothetical protein
LFFKIEKCAFVRDTNLDNPAPSGGLATQTFYHWNTTTKQLIQKSNCCFYVILYCRINRILRETFFYDPLLSWEFFPKARRLPSSRKPAAPTTKITALTIRHLKSASDVKRLLRLHGTDLSMDLQIKLDNVFKRLVEVEDRFGAHNKFISLSVRNLDGSTSTDENSGKIYLGILKFYNITGNDFQTVDLFIKIEPRIRGEEGLIKYDFKFYNEYVAYKHILPVLNKSFANRIEGEPRSVPKRFSEQADNAYTIEEFTNDVRYREIGKLRKREYRHSWNSFDKMKTEMKFYTIRPNSRFAVDKCATYEKHVTRHGATYEKHGATYEKSHGAVANEILKLFPKFYHGEVGDGGGTDNIIVIENMLPAGFHTDNEGLFLDKDRILLTLKTLGEL